ncbi:hypothetical protein QTN25_010369 [Entamoeba marina]
MLREENNQLTNYITTFGEKLEQQDKVMESVLNEINHLQSLAVLTNTNLNDSERNFKGVVLSHTSDKDATLETISNTTDYFIQQTSSVTSELASIATSKQMFTTQNTHLEATLRSLTSKLEQHKIEYSKLEAITVEENLRNEKTTEEMNSMNEKVKELTQERDNLPVISGIEKKIEELGEIQSSYKENIDAKLSELQNTLKSLLSKHDQYVLKQKELQQQKDILNDKRWLIVEKEDSQLDIIKSTLALYEQMYGITRPKSEKEIYSELEKKQLNINEWNEYIRKIYEESLEARKKR